MKKETKDKNISSWKGTDFIKRLGEEGWTYIKTVVDIMREPVLILDQDLRVMAANEPFYKTFQTEQKDTEDAVLYELGNGQWNIPALRKLLENILPENTFFKGFEVTHDFPVIGRKIMILNAREIHCKENKKLGPCPPIILLAIEDVTDVMDVAEMLSRRTSEFEVTMAERTEKLEIHIKKLEGEIELLIGRIKI
jgi:chemotaxis protein methyltransferase CheR